MRIKWTWLLVIAVLSWQCQKDESASKLASNPTHQIGSKFENRLPNRYLAALLHLSKKKSYPLKVSLNIGNELIGCGSELSCLRELISFQEMKDFESSLRTVELPEIQLELDHSSWQSDYNRTTHRFNLVHKSLHYSLDVDMDNEVDDSRSIGIIPNVNGNPYKIDEESGLINNIYEPSTNEGRIKKINIHTQGEQVRFEFVAGPFDRINDWGTEEASILTSVEFYLDVNQHLGIECTGIYKLMFNKAGTSLEVTNNANELISYKISTLDNFLKYLEEVRTVEIFDGILGHFELLTDVEKLQLQTLRNHSYVEIDFETSYKSQPNESLHSFFTIMQKVANR